MIPRELADRIHPSSPMFLSVGMSSTLTSVATMGHRVAPKGCNLPGIRWGETLEIDVEPHTYPLRRVTLSVFARFAGEAENVNKSIAHCMLPVNELEMQRVLTHSSPLKSMGSIIGTLRINVQFVFTSHGERYLADMESKVKTYRPFSSIKSRSGASDCPTLRSVKSAGSAYSNKSTRSIKSSKSTKSPKRSKLKAMLALFKPKSEEPLEDIVPPVVLKDRQSVKSRASTRGGVSTRGGKARLNTAGTTIRTTNPRATVEPSRHTKRIHTLRNASPVVSSNPSHFRKFSSSSSIYDDPPSASFSAYTQQRLMAARDTQMALRERRVSRDCPPPDLKSRGTDYSAEVENYSHLGTDDHLLMSPDLASKLATPLSSRLASEANSYHAVTKPLMVRKSRGGTAGAGATGVAGAAGMAPVSTAGSFIRHSQLSDSRYERRSIPPSQQSCQAMYGHHGQFGSPQRQWSQGKLLRNIWQDENQEGVVCQCCGR